MAALPEIPKQEHYPPYVVTDEDRARWDVSMAVAEATSEQFEPDHPNRQFVWHYARTVYFSEIPTGDPSELEQPDEPAGDAA